MKQSTIKNSLHSGNSYWFYGNIILITLIGTSLIASCNQIENIPAQPTATYLTYSTLQQILTFAPISSPTQMGPYTFSSPITPTPSPTIEPSSTITIVPWTYTFPVQPTNRLVSYKEGVAAHGYPAIDIFAPVGYEYVAATDGTVEYVSFKDTWDPKVDDPGTRGGVAIAIIGDDGFRYYGSHLSKIAKSISLGMHISAGEVLGYIGDSGNAIGRGSHLHFGISRPTFPDDWKIRRGEINPYPYLNAWAAGLNITPVYTTPTPKPTP